MKSSKRTIAVVTGSRAEFGLLTPVMRAIDAHPKLRLRVIVAGLHLSQGTWRDVRNAGFEIAARAPMQRPGVTGRAADVQALARGIGRLGDAFDRLRPDVVVVLGDRIEALAAACAANVGGFHLAHIHGGDRAEGVADESMRHAVSKLAHVHFAATALSRKRLVRMGEDPRCVFNVGSPAMDGLRDVQPAPDAPQVIVVQHPIGASDAQERRRMTQTLRATAGYTRLVLGPNADPGSAGIRAAAKAAGVAVVDHVPHERFRALLAGARAIVGNSSSGLIEAAGLGVPCVNVGPRQAGRERPPTVIDCDYGESSVRTALRRAFHMKIRGTRHPYGDGRAGPRIARLLSELDLKAIPQRKHNAY